MKYAVSDIHGRYDKYWELLKALDLGKEDILYILGDVIDRGPEGFHILRDMAERPNVVGIMGNHEAVAVDALPSLLRLIERGEPEFSVRDIQNIGLWFRNGGAASLNDYLQMNTDDAKTALEYMQKLPLYKETHAGGKDFVLVHGGLESFSPSKPLANYKRDEIVWYRL